MLNQNELIKFEEYLQQRGYAESTIKRLMKSARRVMRYGIDDSDIKEIRVKCARKSIRQVINRPKDYEASKEGLNNESERIN